MGFHEDDRIRSKNRLFNFPTSDINYAARKIISETGRVNLVEKLQLMLSNNEDVRTREILKTAIIIAKTE